MNKAELRERFGTDPDRYYKVELFDRLGFFRRKCPSCGKHFWTLREDQERCPDPPCTPYGFIGNPPTRMRTDYIKTWRMIEKFFVKAGHTSIPSYPVVCRWFPGLFFNIASIVSFQRSVAGQTVFELPANPLIIPQVCLRFNDIPNVGVSGRHHTSFIMIGQHSLYDGSSGYWKDRCIELDWELMTKVLKIPHEEISFVEDVWVGPAAFGYSLEYFVRGLELGNAVFTEFLGQPENYRVMERKIVDMGAGHERFVWLMNGSPTSYDASFGPVIKKLKSSIDYDVELFENYAIAAGGLNVEDVADLQEAKRKIANQLGVSFEKLQNETKKLEAVYAIADHAKTLLYAIVDGQLPSNVGGGYNLRVILRRALGFIDSLKLPFDLYDVCLSHARYLQKMDRKLTRDLDELKEIIEIESNRYREHRVRVWTLIENILKRKITLDSSKLTELYESHGITPEMISERAALAGITVELPADAYIRLTNRHMGEVIEEKKIDVHGLPPTNMLFYTNPTMKRFTARVLRIIDGKWVVLDQTAFYGRAGGQEPDLGEIDGCRVYDVEKIGNVIVHGVENPKFEEGDFVEGYVDWKRRKQLTIHHTAAHIIGAACRNILGNHVWQAGAFKGVDRARLDISHHSALTQKQLLTIEKAANAIVKKNITIKKHLLPRQIAEQRYGFRIYQGGAVPEAKLRIIEIPRIDAQACGGLHLNKTGECEKIVLLSSERIQDGVVRLNFVAGPAAEAWLKEQDKIVSSAAAMLGVKKVQLLKAVSRLVEKHKKLKKKLEERTKIETKKIAEELEKKFINNVLIEVVPNADLSKLKEISRLLSSPNRVLFLFGLSDKIYVWGASNSKTDAGKIVERICKELGGKGGGNPRLGQGFGLKRESLESLIKKLKGELL